MSRRPLNPHSPDNARSFGAACAMQIQRSASYPGSSEAAMAHPTGESGSDAVRLDFDRRLMLQFRGSLVTSDAELLAYRELDDVLGLTEMAGDVLADARSGKNGRHALAGLFRHSVFGRLAGYEDVNDAERLRHDPAIVARYQGRSHASIFERARPWQCPRSTSFWRRSGSNTRSGYRPTRFCRAGSAICLRAQSDDLRTICAGSMPISAIRPEPGPSRGGLSPRSSGIPENFIPASASS